jgi:hypothetical protein
MYRTLVFTLLASSTLLPLAAYADSTQAQYEQAHKMAVATHEEAGKAGNQWTTTSDVLDSADAAAKTGDYEKAMALAQRAQALAKLELAQAEDRDWQKAKPE